MNNLEKILISHLSRYNHKKYWKRREYVVNASKKNRLLKWIYLYQIKRSDYFNGSSFGTDINKGAFFETPPILPHGPKGIIVNPNSKIGRNCTIFHQVTIGSKNGFSPIIGNNVVIYPGAKIIGNVHIGDNAVVAPNAVIIKDVGEGEIVGGIPGRVIGKQDCQYHHFL